MKHEKTSEKFLVNKEISKKFPVSQKSRMDFSGSQKSQGDFLGCQKEKNLKNCNCTYSCSKKGICCECLHYHLKNRQLPACCFPEEAERTYDRSFEHFAKLIGDGGI